MQAALHLCFCMQQSHVFSDRDPYGIKIICNIEIFTQCRKPWLLIVVILSFHYAIVVILSPLGESVRMMQWLHIKLLYADGVKPTNNTFNVFPYVNLIVKSVSFSHNNSLTWVLWDASPCSWGSWVRSPQVHSNTTGSFDSNKLTFFELTYGKSKGELE